LTEIDDEDVSAKEAKDDSEKVAKEAAEEAKDDSEKVAKEAAEEARLMSERYATYQINTIIPKFNQLQVL